MKKINNSEITGLMNKVVLQTRVMSLVIQGAAATIDFPVTEEDYKKEKRSKEQLVDAYNVLTGLLGAFEPLEKSINELDRRIQKEEVAL